MVTTRAREICVNCGSHIIIPDEDGNPYCLMCQRPHHSFRDYGRIGGLQTVLKHPAGYMKELGAKGGRPRLRQLPVPEVQSQLKGGNRLPNSLKGLRELHAAKIKEGGSRLSFKPSLHPPEGD